MISLAIDQIVVDAIAVHPVTRVTRKHRDPHSTIPPDDVSSDYVVLVSEIDTVIKDIRRAPESPIVFD
jgi:hypothetical protein